MYVFNCNILTVNKFTPVQSFITNVFLNDTELLRVVKDPQVIKVDEPTYARLLDFEFENGTLEVKVLSKLLPDAPDYARGFIGVAFRIDEMNSQFEAIYIRPTNGRHESPIKRSNATQYFSYPDYKFDRFRSECPGKYESCADIGLDEWIDVKIVVRDEHAELYLNQSIEPALTVSNLKHGAHKKGAIGLWVDIGTEGFFKDLRITKT